METEYLNDKDIKNELAEILKDTDAFLRKNKIEYSIYGGTLLGAVRHHGFIPWDDDIDIAILRPDYDRLVSLLKENNQIGNNLRGIGYELGEKDWPFLKIVNPAIRVKEGEKSIDDYLWIDVFPIDAIPDLFSSMHLIRVHYLYRKLFFFKRAEIYNIPKDNSKYFIKLVYDSILNKIAHSFSAKSITDKYIAMCSKYNVNCNKMVGEIVWGKELFEKRYFDSLSEYDFEGLKVTGFDNYDGYLKMMYGDYMKLPPEEQRINHGVEAWRDE